MNITVHYLKGALFSGHSVYTNAMPYKAVISEHVCHKATTATTKWT